MLKPKVVFTTDEAKEGPSSELYINNEVATYRLPTSDQSYNNVLFHIDAPEVQADRRYHH